MSMAVIPCIYSPLKAPYMKVGVLLVVRFYTKS